MGAEHHHANPDVDRGSQLAATYIAGCAISLFFVSMRLSARWSITSLGVDDWSMVVTWIVFLPLTVIVSFFSFNGGTRHLEYLAEDPACMQYILMLNWIAQPLAIFCLGTGKIAVSLLIIRLLNRSSVWRRWSLYIACALTAANTVLMIVFTFAQCQNPAALWDDEVKGKTTCWDPTIQSSFSIYGASFHAALDFYLALIPITLVWGLKTSAKKRVALCALLGCGCLTGICATIKTTKLIALNARSDFTWATFGLFMWTGIEIMLCMICGSIPALKPVYALCIGRRQISTFKSQRSQYTRGRSNDTWNDADTKQHYAETENPQFCQVNLGYGNRTVVLAPIKPPEMVRCVEKRGSREGMRSGEFGRGSEEEEIGGIGVALSSPKAEQTFLRRDGRPSFDHGAAWR